MTRSLCQGSLALLLTALAVPGCLPDSGGGGDDGTVVIIDDQPAGGEQRPDEMPGEQPPGEEPPVEEPPVEEPPIEEPPAPTCTDNSFDPVHSEFRETDQGFRYLGFDSLESPTRVLVVEFRTDRGLVLEPGVYDLTDTDLNTCQICAFAIEGLDLQSGARRFTALAHTGALEISAIGGVGETFAARFNGVNFHEVRVTPGEGDLVDVEVVEDGGSLCAHDHALEETVLPIPAMIGEPVRDFQLQNCQTDEFVSVHTLAADTRALWIIGSAGWCSACRQYLPQVFNLMNTIEPTQAKLLIVVGEDGAYAQPTTGYCRRYAEHYGLPDASNFYIDHNGVSSFSTLFTYLNLYSNDGAFGLPWNAVVSGGNAPVYEYSDGSGQAQTLVEVLREVAGLPIQ